MSPSGNLASSGASCPHLRGKTALGDWNPHETLLHGVCWQPWLRPPLEELRALTKEVPRNIEGQMANDSETRKLIHCSHKPTKVRSVIFQRPLFMAFPSRPLNHLILFIKYLPSYCSSEELKMSLKVLKGIMAFHHSMWSDWALAVCKNWWHGSDKANGENCVGQGPPTIPHQGILPSSTPLFTWPSEVGAPMVNYPLIH